MIVIACVDDQNGMMFNRRRQSQDQLLRENLLQSVGARKLWMNSYSRAQFSDTDSEQIVTDSRFLENAPEGDYCFVEDQDLSRCLARVEKIILFRWNRRYPADTYFPLDLSLWTLECTESFPGHSHEKITKETYRK